jgi:hypothetical protein
MKNMLETGNNSARQNILQSGKGRHIQVDRNLMLYLPRLAVLVSIEADRPGA